MPREGEGKGREADAATWADVNRAKETEEKLGILLPKKSWYDLLSGVRRNSRNGITSDIDKKRINEEVEKIRKRDK